MRTQDADAFFQQFVFGFMYNDIRRAIDFARANFLVALGLSAYTEVMDPFCMIPSTFDVSSARKQ